MTCIYDRDDECTYDCEGCFACRIKCCSCGAESSEAVLYEFDGEIRCIDCFIEDYGNDFISDFASEYSDEFRDFFIRENENNRILNFEEETVY